MTIPSHDAAWDELFNRLTKNTPDTEARRTKKHTPETDISDDSPKTPAADAELFDDATPPDADESQELQHTRHLVSQIHNATSNCFASLGLPLKLQVLVCAIIAASNGETHFQASYAKLVYLLFRHGDGRTYEAKKSEVRRLLAGLRCWQEKTGITLCTIVRGGRTYDEEGNEVNHETEFKLILLDAIAKTLQRNPAPERMRGAVQAELTEMMKLPAFDARWQPRAATDEEIQRRNRKACITKALKACEAEQAHHGDPVAYAERIAQDIIDAARQHFDTTSGQDEVSMESNVENEDFSQEGGVSNPTHPPPSEIADDRCEATDKTATTAAPTSESTVDAEIASITDQEEVLNPGNEGETRAGQTSNGARVSPTPPFSGQPSVERKPSLFDPSEPEGLQLIRLFESVGVRRFGVTLFDEPTQNVLEYLTLSATAFRRELPIFLQRNAVDPISIIGRPLAHHVIQLDDLGIDTQREFHATAFAILHTSPAHFTAWLALPVGTSKAERVEVRRRLLQRFDCTDAGASGATRWPGSRNVKHTKEKDKPHIPVHGRDGVYPKVRLFYRKPGRHVAVAELEKIYQLPPAPEPPPPQPNSAATSAACRPPCKFPDYETELARAPRRKDGSDNPDRSVADLRWSILALRWRWPIAAVEAKLDEVSSKELRGAARRRHVRRTVAVAARAVGLLG